MNIAINIINIIDIILILILSILSDSLKVLIVWTILAGAFCIIFWNIIVEKQESMKNLKWYTLVISSITLCELIIVIIIKSDIDIVSNFSLQIPMYIAYLAMLIKVKKEGYDE